MIDRPGRDDRRRDGLDVLVRRRSTLETGRQLDGHLEQLPPTKRVVKDRDALEGFDARLQGLDRGRQQANDVWEPFGRVRVSPERVKRLRRLSVDDVKLVRLDGRLQPLDESGNRVDGRHMRASKGIDDG